MPLNRRSALRCIGVALFLAFGTSVGAQNIAAQGTPVIPPSADSVFARARRLVTSGNGAAGRILVDSMVAAAPPDSPTYAEALYWRAALATSTADAERDYRRIVVDYWYAPHLGDALLQLAQIETTRGDRAAATDHLERFMAEAPQHPDRARAGLMLVRLLFDQNDVARGCTAWRQATTAATGASVELRNQLSYYAARCSANDVSAGSRVPVAYPPGTQPTLSVAKDTSTARHDSTASAPKGRYTLQIAAYGTKTEAARLVSRLSARGITARVVGDAKPYRVRVGRYDTRTAALAAQSQLKAKKLSAIVTEVGPDDK
jgi:septal ring-binding cell division protein DamX